MNARQLEIRVGVAACGLVALCALAVAVLGGPDAIPPVALQVDFPAAAGLKVGAKVAVAGVPAGEVTALSAHDGVFDAALNRRVYVRAALAIEAIQADRISADSVFTITTEGMLGERYIEITPGSVDAPRLTEGMILPGVRSFQQKELSENAGAVGRVVERLVRKHSEPLSGFGADLKTIVNRSGATFDRAESMVEEHDPTLSALGERLETTRGAASELGSNLMATMTAVEESDPVRDLHRAAKALQKGGTAVDGDAQVAVERLDALRVASEELGELAVTGTDSWSKAGASIPRDLRALRRLINSIETSLGALMGDREFLDDVLGMTKDVKRHPWKMLMRWEH